MNDLHSKNVRLDQQIQYYHFYGINVSSMETCDPYVCSNILNSIIFNVGVILDRNSLFMT